MRLLVVAPRLPYPPTDGQRVRTWHLLRALRQAPGVEVTLLTWRAADDGDDIVDAVEGVVDRLLLAPLRAAPPGLAQRLGRQVRFLAGGRPPYVQEMADERRACPPLPPADLVVLEEEALADLRLTLPAAPVLLHRLNVFGELIAQVRHDHVLRRVVRPLELRAWRRFDRRVSSAVDHVVAVTPESAEVLRRLAPGTPVEVVTNGVELPAVPLQPSAGSDVAFIGWMAYPANIDAVRWLVADVWPRVRAEVPDARLRIIGREPSPAVLALAADDIVVTGEVPEVVAAAAGARLGVVPLRGGMGIKNKTLELLAMGLPVVSTPAGAEGLPAPADGVLRADVEPDALAAAMVRLLRDPAEADRLGAAARAYVAAQFSWETVGLRYRAVLTSCTSRNT